MYGRRLAVVSRNVSPGLVYLHISFIELSAAIHGVGRQQSAEWSSLGLDQVANHLVEQYRVEVPSRQASPDLAGANSETLCVSNKKLSASHLHQTISSHFH